MQEFQNAMRAAGLDYRGPIIADGKLHRIKINGEANPNGWYVFHPDEPAAGMFGCWKRGIQESWCERSSEQLTPAEREERDRRWQQQQAERDAERTRLQDEAGRTAQAILDAAQPATDEHPYLHRKRVQAHPSVMVGHWPQRKADNCLLLPLRTAAGTLASVQAIYPEPRGGRDKDFLRGGAKSGAYFVIGELEGSNPVLTARATPPPPPCTK